MTFLPNTKTVRCIPRSTTSNITLCKIDARMPATLQRIRLCYLYLKNPGKRRLTLHLSISLSLYRYPQSRFTGSSLYIASL